MQVRLKSLVPLFVFTAILCISTPLMWTAGLKLRVQNEELTSEIQKLIDTNNDLLYENENHEIKSHLTELLILNAVLEERTYWLEFLLENEKYDLEGTQQMFDDLSFFISSIVCYYRVNESIAGFEGWFEFNYPVISDRINLYENTFG